MKIKLKFAKSKNGNWFNCNTENVRAHDIIDSRDIVVEVTPSTLEKSNYDYFELSPIGKIR